MKRYTLPMPFCIQFSPYVYLTACITLLCSFSTGNSAAQIATVEFVVDMAFSPLGPDQVVVVQGRSETLGGFQGGDLQCLPAGGTLYSVTVDFLDSDLGKEIYYKFVILGPGDEVQREHRGPRNFTLTTGQTVLEPVHFNDIDRPILEIDLPVQFTLDMGGYEGEQPTSVGIAGTEWPLSMKAPSHLQIMQEENGLWVTNILFETGTPTDISFKFFFEIDGRWKEEKHEHAVKLNSNRSSRTIAMVHNGQRIVPASRDREILTDDFEAISAALGANGARHLYNAALQQLAAGQLNKANNLFSQFVAGYEGVDATRLQDKYDIAYAQYLYANGQKITATTYLTNKEANTAEPSRKAAFAHAMGASQQAAADYSNAIISFETAENNYGTEAAIFGKGVNLIKTGQYQSGTQVLESLETTEIRRLAALATLGHAHADSANTNAARATFTEMTLLGTDEEKVKAELLSIELDYQTGAYSQALAGVDDLLMEENGDGRDRLRRAARNRHREAHLLLLKGLILKAQGQDGTAFFQEVISQFPDTKYARRAARRLDN